MNSKLLISAVTLLGLLGACGDDDDATVPVVDADPVPASALASAQAFSAFAASVVTDDQAEPFSLDKVEPPTSDSDEPIELS